MHGNGKILHDEGKILHGQLLIASLRSFPLLQDSYMDTMDNEQSQK